MDKTAYLIVDVEVKFRAFFFTFGTVKEKKVISLPPAAVLVISILAPIPVYSLDKNGVKVNLYLTDTLTP
jgi:hypothetical protein